MWLFVTSVIILIFWVIIVPCQARALIAELKRQLRLWVIQYAGERAAQAAEHQLFQKAIQAGHDPDLVKEILAEDWDIIRERLGRQAADEILGEPSSLERYG